MPNAQLQEAPPALVGHSALSLTVSTQGQLAKDSILNVGSKMIVFGGGDGRQANNLTALVDSTTFTYTVINVRGAPPAERVGHAAALVGGAGRERMWVFGGFVPSSRLTRRPPSPAAAPRGPPCHSYRPGRFPSS